MFTSNDFSGERGRPGGTLSSTLVDSAIEDRWIS